MSATNFGNPYTNGYQSWWPKFWLPTLVLYMYCLHCCTLKWFFLTRTLLTLYHQQLYSLFNKLFRLTSKKHKAPHYRSFATAGNPPVYGIPSSRTSNAESISMSWWHHELLTTGVGNEAVCVFGSIDLWGVASHVLFALVYLHHNCWSKFADSVFHGIIERENLQWNIDDEEPCTITMEQ